MLSKACAAGLLAFLLTGQSSCQTTPLTLPERVALARPLLMHAEDIAASAPPAQRAFLLYRSAGAWLNVDPSHAIDLDRRAFAAARLIEPLSLRQSAEHDILSDLLPLSPSSALDLIPQAEPQIQEKLMRAYTNFTHLDDLMGQFVPHGLTSYASETGAHSLGLSSLDMGLEFTIPLNLSVGLGVTGSIVSPFTPGSPEAALLGTGYTCPKDVSQILESIDTIPVSRKVVGFCLSHCGYSTEFPRVQVLNNVAERCTYYPGRSEAIMVLKAEAQAIEELPQEVRVNYLAVG